MESQTLTGSLDTSTRLYARNLNKRFGVTTVLTEVNIQLGAGEVLGVVGPNGAGKTTLLSILSGAMQPDSGEIYLHGKNVSSTRAPQRCRAGIVRTHQVPKPFTGMSVYENVLTAVSFGRQCLVADSHDSAVSALECCGMLGMANRSVASLGLLDRKRLELARALGTNAQVLLLDEIGGGLSDAESGALIDIIKSVNQSGTSIIWIEHIVHVLVQVITRLVCLDAGRVLADGAPDEVLQDERVIEAYLGSTPA